MAKAYNLKISTRVGLQKDWGIFNLYGPTEEEYASFSACRRISIEVMTDADSFIENTPTSVMHAASSSYRELDAIQPLVADSLGNISWNVNSYGSEFKQIMNGYYPISVGLEDGDIWSTSDTYKNYINQFEVTFRNEPSVYSSDDTNAYYDSKQNVKYFKDKHYIKRTLKDITGNNYILANIDLIHFSKYYYIYSPSTIPIPTLRPLIYDETKLDDYGFSVDSQGKPHLKTLLMWGMQSDDSEETFEMRKVPYNGSKYDWAGSNPEIGFTRGVHNGMSMFKSCPQPDAEYPYKSEESEFYDFMPEGFSLTAIWRRGGIYNGDNGTHSSAYDEKYIPITYTKYFDMSNTKYNQPCMTSDDANVILMGIVYFGDQQQNFRMFNTYFPVFKATNESLGIIDEIRYKSSYQGKEPATISLAIASVLANIYKYTEDTRDDVNYISDCVYLASNSTLYTKDIVYKASVTPNAEVANSKMLLFQGLQFSEYIDHVVKVAKSDTTIGDSQDYEKTSTGLNIDPDINACIKNIPIQLNINYIEPNIESVGAVNNLTRVYTIDGKQKDMYNWSPDNSTLYQLTLGTDGEFMVNPLSKNFEIRYLKQGSLTLDDNHYLVAEFDDNISPEVNSYIEDIFRYGENNVNFHYTKAVGSDFYSFSTREHHGGSFGLESYYTYGTLKYMPKRDVLIPFAKMM